MTKANALKERLENLTLDQLLKVWEWTTAANNEQIPLIREHLMNELERRNPQGFNVWLDKLVPRDEELRWYIEVNPICLDCRHWKADCMGTREQAYTGCIYKVTK